MKESLQVIATCAVTSTVLLMWLVMVHVPDIRREITKIVATSAQATQDLKDFFTSFLSTFQQAVTDFDALLSKVQAANGVDPAVVESLTQSGRDAVTTMKTELAKVEAVINGNPAPGVVISISPTSATIPVGGTQQFSATVTGASDTSVGWDADQGTVDANGLYTAPATPGTYTVAATSSADHSQFAKASVTVQ